MKIHCGFLRIVSGLLIGLAIAATSSSQTEPEARLRIAKAYGFQSWDQVEQLRFTFNVQRGKDHLARSWVWETKPDRVSFAGVDKQGKPVKLTYLRSEMGTPPAEQTKRIDADFINDQYWLLFPFHVAWDQAAMVEDTGLHKLPISPGRARRIVVTYPPSGGYTPGDTYELFVGGDGRIVQWIYRRGGAAKPTLLATWEEYRRLGPLIVSLNHRGAERNFRVWFTDVAVKLVGVDGWIAAK